MVLFMIQCRIIEYDIKSESVYSAMGFPAAAVAEWPNTFLNLKFQQKTSHNMRPPFQLQSAASHKDIVEREHRSDSRTQTRQIPRPRSQCQTLSPLETRCLKPIGRIAKTKPTPLISQGRSSHNLSLSLSLFILTIIIMIIFIYLIESIQQVFHFIREEQYHVGV